MKREIYGVCQVCFSSEFGEYEEIQKEKQKSLPAERKFSPQSKRKQWVPRPHWKKPNRRKK